MPVFFMYTSRTFLPHRCFLWGFWRITGSDSSVKLWILQMGFIWAWNLTLFSSCGSPSHSPPASASATSYQSCLFGCEEHALRWMGRKQHRWGAISLVSAGCDVTLAAQTSLLRLCFSSCSDHSLNKQTNKNNNKTQTHLLLMIIHISHMF